jgi:hypothetical protein
MKQQKNKPWNEQTVEEQFQTILGGAIALAILISCCVGVYYIVWDKTPVDSTPLTTDVSTATPQPTTEKSPIPTATRTPTPHPSKPLKGRVIGGSESAFRATYGSPGESRTISSTTAEENFFIGADNISRVGIDFYTPSMIVYAILVGTTGIWDGVTAINVCTSFGPPDAVYGGHQDLHDKQGNVEGIFQMGQSDMLASNFDRSYFKDNARNLVEPGSFGIGYYYLVKNDDTLLNICALDLGYQPIEN